MKKKRAGKALQTLRREEQKVQSYKKLFELRRERACDVRGAVLAPLRPGASIPEIVGPQH